MRVYQIIEQPTAPRLHAPRSIPLINTPAGNFFACGGLEEPTNWASVSEVILVTPPVVLGRQTLYFSPYMYACYVWQGYITAEA